MMKLQKLVIATENKGKLEELEKLLAHFDIEVLTLASFPDYVAPEETGVTYEENACLKAEAAMQEFNLPILADDSGLSIAALNGDPGVYSARWAENDSGERDFQYAMQRVLKALEGQEDRSASFHTVLALAVPGQQTRVFYGQVDGEIQHAPRGEGGFGYDPLFQPTGYEQTFAEMPFSEKLKMSHRTDALNKFREWFASQYAA